MHAEAYNFLRQHVRGNARTVLELGSLDINGSPRYLFPVNVTYVGLDLQSGRGVDLVADAASPLLVDQLADVLDWRRSGDGLVPGFDVVICAEVLEHAVDPGSIVGNAWRALHRGGQVVVTCATEPRAPHSAVNGAGLQPGEHYRNVEEAELFDWLRPFASIGLTKDRVHGDLYACAVKP